jgi:hypothetical protein
MSDKRPATYISSAEREIPLIPVASVGPLLVTKSAAPRRCPFRSAASTI